jgi:hypothetical protein
VQNLRVGMGSEYNFSTLTLVQGGSNYRNECTLNVSVNAGTENDLLLTLNVNNSMNGKKMKEVASIEYFDEKQIIEMYHFLKSALLTKYPNI